MPLPQKSLLDFKKESTPEVFANTLREGGDVFWWEKGKFWLVTSHALASAVLKNEDFSCDRRPFFISRMPEMDLSLLQDFFGVVGRFMVMSDGKQHQARRRIAALGLTDAVLARFLPVIEKTVDTLLDQAGAWGECDFAQDIAPKLPSLALADLFRIPESERENFYLWSNNMTQFFGGSTTYTNDDGIRVNESARNIRAYFVDLMRRRREKPEDDFLSILLSHQESFGLDDEDVLCQAIMMLVAGQITTTDQMCNNLFTLLSSPGALKTLRENPEHVRLGIEELNRLDPAVTFLFRVTAKDTAIGSQPVKKGDVVFVSAHAVNRDPDVFENPDTCTVPRRSNPHLAYGFGPHVCLGAKLARLEMATLFGRLIERFPGLRLDETQPSLRKHHSLAFSGFARLPIVL